MDDTDKCDLAEFISYPSIVSFLLYSIFAGIFPIAIFIIFGLRRNIFQFWIEYIKFMIKKRTITFQFIPSFDPQTSKTTVNELNSIEDVRDKESESTLQKLKKRVKEL